MVETLVSVAINAAMSVGFVFLIFHGQTQIYATGRHGIVADMAPQTFMVAFMSCLVPGLLTRQRHVTGALTWQATESQANVSHVWLRAGGVALLAMCLVVAISEATLPNLLPRGISFRSLVMGKALFGMLLAAMVTPWAIARVLR